MGLSEIFSVIKLSVEKFLRLLKMRDSGEVTFTKIMDSPEDIKDSTAIEVKNCKFFWVARKKKKDKGLKKLVELQE